MSSPIVDAKGKLCPQPLIMTKKALVDLEPGQTITVLIDNDISRKNVERFLADNNTPVETTEADGVFTLTVTKASEALSAPDAASYCTISPIKPHVVCIKSKRMGEGDDTLGELLMKAFINTIDEVDPLPDTLVFYNSGIFLALKDSPVLDALNELSEKGVKILVCGTCADYFKKKDDVAAGIISNMYTISEALVEASKVVSP